MKMITLKELKDRFHPNLTKQQFAKEMGLANSVCSKMMRGRNDSSMQSKAWIDLCDYVRTKYNLQLVSENKFAVESDKAWRAIEGLKRENEELKRIKKEYEEVIEELMDCIRITKRAEDAVNRANYRLQIYGYKEEK